MPENNKKFLRVLKIELALGYRFPIIEGLIAVLVFISGLGVLSVYFMSVGMNIMYGPDYNATQTVATYVDIYKEAKTFAFIASLQGCIGVLIILVPIFIAFTLAKPFEDGTLRTLLSYPIGRLMMLNTKIAVLTSLISMSSIFSGLVWIGLLIPGDWNIEELGLLIVAFLAFVLILNSVSVLIAIVSKKSSVTSVIGVLLWTMILTMSLSLSNPLIISDILNPVSLAMSFIMGEDNIPTMYETLTYIGGTILLSVCLILVTIKIFIESEV
jgi:ABC-type transport system involved in multi-copper enzyme maturation permease subunit